MTMRESYFLLDFQEEYESGLNTQICAIQVCHVALENVRCCSLKLLSASEGIEGRFQGGCKEGHHSI